MTQFRVVCACGTFIFTCVIRVSGIIMRDQKAILSVRFFLLDIYSSCEINEIASRDFAKTDMQISPSYVCIKNTQCRQLHLFRIRLCRIITRVACIVRISNFNPLNNLQLRMRYNRMKICLGKILLRILPRIFFVQFRNNTILRYGSDKRESILQDCTARCSGATRRQPSRTTGCGRAPAL